MAKSKSKPKPTRRKKRPPECPSSPSETHEFTPDLEYDSSGQTVNCEHCGLEADRVSVTAYTGTRPTPATSLTMRDVRKMLASALNSVAPPGGRREFIKRGIQKIIDGAETPPGPITLREISAVADYMRLEAMLGPEWVNAFLNEREI